MSRYLWPLVTAALIAVTGGCLMAAPFQLRYQLVGVPWNAATTWTFWSGAGVAALGLAALGAWYAGLRRALGATGRQETPAPVEGRRGTPSEAPRHSVQRMTDAEVASRLRPLAEAVLGEAPSRSASGEGS